MEGYLQRLRQLLTQGGLTAMDARDGMVAAYLVISRLNQIQGNPEVGLKQDEAGLFQHLSGFLGAIFWERGYNYDHPAVNQLSEVKMMMDGIAQVYAMPEDLQMALNEICDFLLARAGNQPAVVSHSVMDLLEYKGESNAEIPAEVENYSFVPPAAPSAPDTDIMPDTIPGPAAESEPAAPEPVPADIPAAEVNQETGFAPVETAEEPYSDQAPQSGKLEPELVALFDEAMKEDAAQDTLVQTETAPAWENVEPVKPQDEEVTARFEMAPENSAADAAAERPEEPVVAAAEAESEAAQPVKKKRGRKKSTEEPVETEKTTKKKKKNKMSPEESKEAAAVVVPDDYMPFASSVEPSSEDLNTEAVAILPQSGPFSAEPAEPATVPEEPLNWAPAGSIPVTESQADSAPIEASPMGWMPEVAAAETIGEEEKTPEALAAATSSFVMGEEATPSTIEDIAHPNEIFEAIPETIPSGEMEEEVVSQPVAPVMEEEVFSQPVAPVMEEEVVSQPVAPVMEEEVVSQPVAPVMEEEVVSQPVAPVMEEEVVSRPVVRAMEEEVVSRPAVYATSNEPGIIESSEPRVEFEPRAVEEPYRAPEHVSAGRTKLNVFQTEEDETEQTGVSGKSIWGMPLMAGIAVGLLAGAVMTWFVVKKMADNKAIEIQQSADKFIETVKAENEKLKAEAEKVKGTLKEQEAAWRKSPDKPSHMKVGQGVLLYWPNEGMMRKYYVYRGKGPVGNMLKISETPIDINFLYIKNPEAGAWRFAVSALTKEGIETDKGESAVLTLPLR
jgi:hypothetical protein